MLQKIIISTTLISLCILVTILNVTTPAVAGPFGILLIFIFSYVLSLGVMAFFLFWGSAIFVKLSGVLMTRRPLKPISFKHSYYYSTILAIVPILLIGLQSVGSVGAYEVSLIAIFVIIGCVYVSKKVQ